MKKSGRSTQRWDMRRMRKELPKIIRSIAAEDRVLVVGTTTIPWQCEQRVTHSDSSDLIRFIKIKSKLIIDLIWNSIEF